MYKYFFDEELMKYNYYEVSQQQTKEAKMETYFPFACHRIETKIVGLTPKEQKLIREAYRSLGYTSALRVTDEIMRHKRTSNGQEEGVPKDCPLIVKLRNLNKKGR